MKEVGIVINEMVSGKGVGGVSGCWRCGILRDDVRRGGWSQLWKGKMRI
jgi:hypothetical protein